MLLFRIKGCTFWIKCYCFGLNVKILDQMLPWANFECMAYEIWSNFDLKLWVTWKSGTFWPLLRKIGRALSFPTTYTPASNVNHDLHKMTSFPHN